MGAPSIVARVRDLVLRAQTGALSPSELAEQAPLLEELRARVERLRALGAEIDLSEDVQALLASVTPASVAA
jgi:hypothetical protein